jgi:hypothetical protein
MKKLIISLVALIYSINAEAQIPQMNGNLWCINYANAFVDSNGHHYMQVNFYNNDSAVNNDSFTSEVYRLDAIVSGTDTIRSTNFGWQHMVFQVFSNTSNIFYIDTSIAINLIDGYLVTRGWLGCGTMWDKSFYISQQCNYNFALNIKYNDELSTNIYPNPVTNELYIDIQFKNEMHQAHELKIYDAIGKLVHVQLISKNTEGSLKINCAKFAKGIYYLNVDNKSTKKFIVQ